MPGHDKLSGHDKLPSGHESMPDADHAKHSKMKMKDGDASKKQPPKAENQKP